MRHALTWVALLWLAAQSVWAADPGYYVVTPYDREGEIAADFRYWTVQMPGSAAVLWPEVGLSYGVTSRWTTELYASYIGTMTTAMKLSTWNWQNDYLLTQGELPVDVALHSNLIQGANPGDGWTLEAGPAVQTDIGRTQLNGNLFLERTYNAKTSKPTQLKYQWQVRHRWLPGFQPGLQGFGELGDADHWLPASRQSHRAGPAFFGTWRNGNRDVVRYQAAYLWGKVYSKTARMFTMRVQYVF